MPMTTTGIRQRIVTVRRAAPEDKGAVRALFGALHAFNAALEPRFALADGWEQVLARHLVRKEAGGQDVTLLAWDGADPVGLAMVAGHVDSPLFRHRRWAELTALYVVSGVRGAGVADRLLAEARTWAGSSGFGELRLYVTASNQQARHFYAKAGLRPIQEIWTMALDLASGADAPSPDDRDREAA